MATTKELELSRSMMARDRILDSLNQIFNEILQSADLEGSTSGYNIHLGRIPAWDYQSSLREINLLKNMDLIENSSLKILFITVCSKNGPIEQAVNRNELKLRLLNNIHGEIPDAPYFTLGFQKKTKFFPLHDIQLSASSSSNELFLIKEKRPNANCRFPLSTKLSESPLNCLGVSARNIFTVSLPNEAVDLFNFGTSGWMKTEEELSSMIDFTARRVNLNPESFNPSQLADYQDYLKEFRKTAKTDLIQKIIKKFGITGLSEYGSNQKSVIFAGDMDAELKVFYNRVENVLRIILKDIYIPKNDSENTIPMKDIIRPKLGQLVGNLTIFIREIENILTENYDKNGNIFFIADSLIQPESLAAILAKMEKPPNQTAGNK